MKHDKLIRQLRAFNSDLTVKAANEIERLRPMAVGAERLREEIRVLKEDLRLERLARFRSEQHFAELSAQLKAAQGAKSPKPASDT